VSIAEPTPEEIVRELIDVVLRPLIESDGGSIDLVEASRERVVVRLLKACAGCPGAQFTKSGVIEPAVRAKLGPQVIVEVLRTT
jgi:NifU-like protein